MKDRIATPESGARTTQIVRELEALCTVMEAARLDTIPINAVRGLVAMHTDDHGLRLVERDNVADARARIYGRQLLTLTDGFDADLFTSDRLDQFVTGLRELAARMTATETATAAARPDMGAGNGRLQEVQA